MIHNTTTTTLREGRVPRDWRRADVTPIHKAGSKEEPLNYRPVLPTSVAAKICEKVIKDRWVTHLEHSTALTERQVGFREGRSCVTNLMSFYSRVTDTVQERDGWADCMYLHLIKHLVKYHTEG